MEKFKELGLRSEVLNALHELGFEKPTEIQEKSIPLVIQGKDVIGMSSTGSGKTLAFASGIFDKVHAGKGIQALIMTPTRELAEQVSQELGKFSKYLGLNIVEVYGGVSLGGQIEKLEKCDVVVGTPGRILDHLERGTLKLNKIEILVLDEADRMVDMGFIPDVERILSQCNNKRQTLLFSATITSDINYISDKYMKDPSFISVKSMVDPSKLQQFFYDVPSHRKFSLLFHLLKEESSGLIMVFCNTRRNADLIANNLNRLKLNALAIHGGLSQARRNAIIEDFHKNKLDILVCTDVAARGLDIKGVTHVYNYDSPPNSNEYIHRIGRTARAGEEGMAISIVSMRDYDNFRNVKSNQSLNIKQKPLPEFEDVQAHFSSKPIRSRSGSRNFGNRGRSSGRSHGRSGGRSHGRSNNSRSSHGSRDSRRPRSRGNSRDGYRGSQSKNKSDSNKKNYSRRD